MTNEEQVEEKVQKIENLERKYKRVYENYDNQLEGIRNQIEGLRDQKQAKKREKRRRTGEIKSEAVDETDTEKIDSIIKRIQETHSSLPYDSQLEKALMKWVASKFEEGTVLEDEYGDKQLTIRDGYVYKYNTSRSPKLSSLTKESNYRTPVRDAFENGLEDSEFETLVEAYKAIDNRTKFKKSGYKLSDDETTVQRILDDTSEDEYHSNSVYAGDSIILKVRAVSSNPKVFFTAEKDKEDPKWVDLSERAPGFDGLKMILKNKEEIVSLLEKHENRAVQVIKEANPLSEIQEIIGDEFIDIYDEVVE